MNQDRLDAVLTHMPAATDALTHHVETLLLLWRDVVRTRNGLAFADALEAQ